MYATPYLFFAGNCAEAFRTYAAVLGGELTVTNWRNSPMEAHAGPDMLDAVLHARLTAPTMMLMGSDSPPDRRRKMQGAAVTITTDTVEEADRVWAALTEGGVIDMPLAPTFWAQRFGMLTDRFGIAWMVNCETPPPAA